MQKTNRTTLTFYQKCFHQQEILMPKTMNIRTLEQSIESLPQADQFDLLEKLLRNLKNSLVLNTSSSSAGLSAVRPGTLRGVLKQYADQSLRDAEHDAFTRAMKVKHADS